MADDKDESPNGDEAEAGTNPSGIPKSANPGTQPEPPYQIMRQYIKDLSFENPNAPAVFAKDLAPGARIAIDVTTESLGGRDVEVVLTVEARADHDSETAYLMELAYAAIVRIGQAPKEALDALLYVEVPRMLFPFVREIVCDVTRSGGFSMLLLAPFDFIQLYRNRLARQQQADAASGNGAGSDTANA